MDLRWKFWHCQLRSRRLGQDTMDHVSVGDLDPTADLGTVNRYQTCQFTWADEPAHNLVLPWTCTRKLGHQGQHLAGTGEWVAAVHPQLVLTATTTNVTTTNVLV